MPHSHPTLPKTRWWLVLSALVAILFTIWLGRSHAHRWTRSRLAAQYQRELAGLNDARSAELVERLAAADDEYLDLVVLSLSDPRPSVADAAQRALTDRTERWSHWTSLEASPRVAVLAELLARSAEQIPLERRGFVQRLAERLLAWPVDGKRVDAAALIADCELVLRLPPPGFDDERLAAIAIEERLPMELPHSQSPALPAQDPVALPAIPQPTQPEPGGPRVVYPQEPAPLPDASRETPLTPRQFVAPRAIRISDD